MCIRDRARTFGRVVVVAPETTQSGMSQAITMYSPLYLRCVREEEGLAVYAFSGTPEMCIRDSRRPAPEPCPPRG